jgi:hypothetical protein
MTLVTGTAAEDPTLTVTDDVDTDPAGLDSVVDAVAAAYVAVHSYDVEFLHVTLTYDGAEAGPIERRLVDPSTPPADPPPDEGVPAPPLGMGDRISRTVTDPLDPDVDPFAFNAEDYTPVGDTFTYGVSVDGIGQFTVNHDALVAVTATADFSGGTSETAWLQIHVDALVAGSVELGTHVAVRDTNGNAHVVISLTLALAAGTVISFGVQATVGTIDGTYLPACELTCLGHLTGPSRITP